MLSRFYIAFILVQTTILSGCVVIPQKNADQILQETSQQRLCTPTPARISFWEELKHGLTLQNEMHPREKRPQDDEWISTAINAEIDKTNFFNFDTKSPHLNIEFQSYYSSQSNVFEQVWYWSTIATLGLLPSWGHGHLQIEASVTDENGAKLRIFKSKEVDFHTINWLPLAPFNIGDRNTNKELVKKITPKLTDEILDQMLQAHLICKR